MQSTDTYQIKKSDGSVYTVRKDRNRYFYPNEWLSFYKVIKPANQPLFDFLINTGARIDEAFHIRPIDFDLERNNVRLWKTKVKAAKGEKTGKPRTLSLSTEYMDRVKKVMKKFGNEDYLWMSSRQAVWNMMRRKLVDAVSDPYNFGLHNIRKTHGMWLKAINVPAEEICLRLGHDYNTYLKHYGSADVFTESDIRAIEKQMGDLYSRKRRY